VFPARGAGLGDVATARQAQQVEGVDFSEKSLAALLVHVDAGVPEA